ncbi:MAG TPA: GNAT family N-acetyltransferase [Candidatus Tumulicola sp.]
MNYVAATQDAMVTRKRVAAASACWVAYRDQVLSGTVCYYAHNRGENGPLLYERGDVAHFGQFAVIPSVQGFGIGSALLDVVEQRALADGKLHLACDTAEPAAHLLDFYRKRGFEVVGRHRWLHARYVSVILSKALRRQ